MKKKFNSKILFIFFSAIVLITLLGIYSYRLIHYYMLENPKVKEGEVVTYNLFDKLRSSLDLKNTGNGLMFDKEKDEYYFKGEAKNNYVLYSGRLFRALKINADGSIQLITNENQTYLANTNKTDFLDSYLMKWLNPKEEVEHSGIFYNSLNEPEKYLVKNTMCLDNVGNSETFTCDTINTDYYVGLISLFEYNKYGSVKSFLNNGSYFWTSSSKENGAIWYIFDKGGINNKPSVSSEHYGVRPTITLKSGTVVYSGKGTKDDPFVIEKIEKESELAKTFVGEYINYSGYSWRIIDIEEDKIKVMMNDVILENDNPVLKEFSTSNNTYSATDKKNIGYYLNNTFYKSLENHEDYLKKGNFYIGAYANSVFDYANIYGSKVNSYVGLPQVSDLFSGDFSEISLLGKINEMSDMIYSVNENGIIRLVSYKTKLQIRPVIFFDSTLLALGGSGTINNPYVIGR